MTQIRKVILSGELAKRYGREHLLAISTPAEAVRALCANHKDFRQFVSDSESRNVGYRVVADLRKISDVEKEIHDPVSQTVRIVPVIGGAKSGFLGVVLGAALIAASFFLPGTALFTVGAFAPSLASISFGIGASLVLGGVSQMLAPQQKPMGAQDQGGGNQPSYVFNGAVNTTTQGNPVPVGYGRLIVGSAVISAGITADEYGAAGME